MQIPRIGKELFTLLNGKALENKQHEAMMLLTVTEDQWPHVAMISVGEIVALDEGNLRLALWPGTTTTGNMIRTGKATLAVFIGGKAHYVRLSLEHLPMLPGAKHVRERFAAQIFAAREDSAQYADIVTGVTIRLKEPEAVLDRWKDTVAELLM
ncbi:pyridoxamine 5'-phosphate oxidase family protein [Paenibacillus sp. 1-18]|uniref:pyridoxamine 5'-phosphate oxidase family protein n=1 Tax=Paenibacillus sp. 1-18 TaxID=1333846 RepID=UPI00046F3E6E|nr:pyridoxamine 5'-phosphate oxidase family protein [Paenibacillus sp. 1-18]